MTTKQIAKMIGKPEQTVRNWMRDLASKSDLIKFKLDASSPMKPADYDLKETCLIIEEGMGADVANAYRSNASFAESEARAKLALSATNTTETRITGALVKNIHELYGHDQKGTEQARKRLDFIMGYKEPIQEQKALPEPKVEIIPLSDNLGRISKAAYAVEMKERAKVEAKKKLDAQSIDLFKSMGFPSIYTGEAK